MADLLEPGFAAGYDEFKELVDWTQNLAGLTIPQRVWALCFERVSVGMIEALNTAENRFETPPHENTIELWSAIGAALATINAQAFTDDGKMHVRREMLHAIKASYDRALKGITEGVPA
ncbi:MULTISPECIES: hypothetical protein [unclassified Mesorhizobium]|uniref:hypothetical protein n=1 Tax=unclassified Mesorhizobium TaxID=325217 RepID=UPI00112AD04B|nr:MULTISPECIES: hypothetical protein [unclassified Mesorhizobium]TPJ97105.1 hypothetical protein FJ489_11725 [Mesorhizobium sp. B2-5-12]